MKVYKVWGFYTIGFRPCKSVYAESTADAIAITEEHYGTSKDAHGLPHRYEAEEAFDYLQDTSIYSSTYPCLYREDGKVAILNES